MSRWSYTEIRDGREWLTNVAWDATRRLLVWEEGPTGPGWDHESGGNTQTPEAFLARGPVSFASPPREVREAIRAFVLGLGA